MVIVTGASSNHAAPLAELLASIAVHEPEARVIVYDLGLLPAELEQLGAAEVRRFPFEQYPPHVARLTWYGWKPIIVAGVLEEVGGPLLWCDAGNLLHGPTAEIAAEVRRTGLYVPLSRAGAIAERTAPLTCEALGMSPSIGARPFRQAAAVGIGPRRIELARRWRAVALNAAVFAPPGWPAPRHIFDQSVLSILAYQVADAEGWTLEDRWLSVSARNDSANPYRASSGGSNHGPDVRLA